MTDGRIPGKWISEPRFAEMGVDAWCIFTKAIAWSNEAGTDGLVKRRYLGQLHPSGEVQPKANEEITALGLWHPSGDGYQFVDWNKKAHQGGLGQELAAIVQQSKDNSKIRQQKWRDKQKAKDDNPLTGDVTRDVTGDVGQDRTGQGSDRKGFVPEPFDEQTGEVFDDTNPWKNKPLKTDSGPNLMDQFMRGETA